MGYNLFVISKLEDSQEDFGVYNSTLLLHFAVMQCALVVFVH